jgi:hypothetical protein
MEKMMRKENPLDITAKDAAKIQEMWNDSAKVDAMWNKLDEDVQKFYDNDKEAWRKGQVEMANNVQEAFTGAQSKIDKLGLDVDLSEMTGSAAHGFANLLENMQFSGGTDAAQEFAETLQEDVLKGADLTDEQKSKLLSTINSIDYKNLDAWDSLGITLSEMGINLPTEDLELLQ